MFFVWWIYILNMGIIFVAIVYCFTIFTSSLIALILSFRLFGYDFAHCNYIMKSAFNSKLDWGIPLDSVYCKILIINYLKNSGNVGVIFVSFEYLIKVFDIVGSSYLVLFNSFIIVIWSINVSLCLCCHFRLIHSHEWKLS